jgi:hypothetical protein
MAGSDPLGTNGVDSVDESDSGIHDEPAVTFR